MPEWYRGTGLRPYLAQLCPEDARRFDADEADFALDYRIWQVEYTDGSARTFDSRTGAFAAKAEVEDETEGAAESACAATNAAPAQPSSAR